MTQGVSGRAAEQDQRKKNSALLLKSPQSFQIIGFRQYNINTNISSHHQFILQAALFDSFPCLVLMGGQNELRTIPIDSGATWLYDWSSTGDILRKVHCLDLVCRSFLMTSCGQDRAIHSSQIRSAELLAHTPVCSQQHSRCREARGSKEESILGTHFWLIFDFYQLVPNQLAASIFSRVWGDEHI